MIHAIIIGLLLAILILLIQGKRRSGFSQSSPITIQPGEKAANSPQELFDIKPSIDCVPGPSESADYYTMGLTPGGLCGGAQSVSDQMRDFTITDGISGSLLED